MKKISWKLYKNLKYCRLMPSEALSTTADEHIPKKSEIRKNAW